MSDIVSGYTFVDGEKGITATKLNTVISGAVIQPSFVSGKPTTPSLDPTDVLLDLKNTGAYAQITGAQLASSVAGQLTLANTTQAGMLHQTSGNTTDFLDGTNTFQPLASAPGLTLMRLRSFNAVGNSTFECDARNVGTALTNPANGAFIQDRYSIVKSALTGTVNTALQSVPTAPIVVPGTNFGITQSFQRFTVGTAQASLAVSDFYGFTQFVEGPQWRELSMDVHSVSLLVRSSVGGLTFSLRLKDPTASHSLVKLCTISTANTWTLVQLPNLPVWVGTYTAAPGAVGYNFEIFLACGTNYQTAANNAWQTGDVRGVTGMSNLLATAGATFDIAFAQHEPGTSTQLMDKPFTVNVGECMRYYQKVVPYGTKALLGNYKGLGSTIGNTATVRLFDKFVPELAKTPTVTYCDNSGVAGRLYVDNSASYVVNSSLYDSRGFQTVTLSTVIGASGSAYTVIGEWVADTGW